MKEILKGIMKKKALIAIAALLLVAGAGGTLAVLTDSSWSLINKFESGVIDTEIEEELGADGKKEPFVTNTGKADCLVRMKVVVSPEEILGNTGSTPNETDLQKILEGLGNNGMWKYGDGYFYYQDILHAQEKTVPLFKKVKSPVEGQSLADFIREHPDLSITVYHEAIPVFATIGEEEVNAEVNGKYHHENALKLWKMYETK